MFDESREMSEKRGLYLIGDLHFKTKTHVESVILIREIIKSLKKLKPAALVLLGDILDTHETAKECPFNLAFYFFNEVYENFVSKGLTKVFVLMGNHDLINNTTFLESKHFFNPYKRWKNFTIVDTVVEQSIEGHSYVFCPYVPLGRFVEALNLSGINWKKATAIFAHQEFFGMFNDFNNTELVQRDFWFDKYPPIFSGHIHTPGFLKPNIYYVGSAIQVAFNEKYDKANVLLKTRVVDGKTTLKMKKIRMNIPEKKTVVMDTSSARVLKLEEYGDVTLKLVVKDLHEKLTIFRTSPKYRLLIKAGVKIEFDPVVSQKNITITTTSTKDNPPFDIILGELVKKKSKATQKVYKKFLEKCRYGELENSIL